MSMCRCYFCDRSFDSDLEGVITGNGKEVCDNCLIELDEGEE